jgi:GNAT superfamily N-acetyltransferase
MGLDPEQVRALVARAYRWDARILLRMLRWFGRPLFDFWVHEEEGTVVGTALVTYQSRAGYISTVCVDPRFRRRGLARGLLERSHRGIRRAGREHAVLDVLDDNVPAQTLYRSMGYRPLRSNSVWTVGLEPSRSAPPSPPPAGLREMAKTDLEAIVELANAAQGPTITGVLPMTPDQLQVPPLLAASVRSTTQAWTLVLDGRPAGFLRATVGGMTRAGHLTRPILGRDVPPARAAGMVTTALEWIAMRGGSRVVVEVPEEERPAREAVRAAGFLPSFRLDTLHLPLSR